MNIFITIWIISLHLIGIIPFYAFLETTKDDDLMSTLEKTSGLAKTIVFFFWPYIIVLLLIRAYLFSESE